MAISSPLALECRECHARYPVEPLTICEECFGPLEPAYDLGAIDGLDFRKHVEAGPASLWRYELLLPGGPGLPRVDLGAGFTPLRQADRLAERLGLRTVWSPSRSRWRARSGSRRSAALARATSRTPPRPTPRRPRCPVTCSCPRTSSARRSCRPRPTAPRSWRSRATTTT